MLAVWAIWGILDKMWKGLADQIDGSADVDVHDEVKVVEVEWVAVAVDDLGWGGHTGTGYDASKLKTSLLGPGDGAVDGGGDGVGLEDVGLEELGVLWVLVDEGGTELLVHVEHGNVGAVLNEVLDGGTTEAGGTVMLLVIVSIIRTTMLYLSVSTALMECGEVEEK